MPTPHCSLGTSVRLAGDPPDPAKNVSAPDEDGVRRAEFEPGGLSAAVSGVPIGWQTMGGVGIAARVSDAVKTAAGRSLVERLGVSGTLVEAVTGAGPSSSSSSRSLGSNEVEDLRRWQRRYCSGCDMRCFSRKILALVRYFILPLSGRVLHSFPSSMLISQFGVSGSFLATLGRALWAQSMNEFGGRRSRLLVALASFASFELESLSTAEGKDRKAENHNRTCEEEHDQYITCWSRC